MLFLLLSLFSLLLLTTSPLFYALLLVLFSISVVFSLSVSSLLPSPMGLLILLVYLGAMMILLAYVCAVAPNLSLALPSFLGILTFIFILLTFISLNILFYVEPSLPHLSFNLTDFFYTPFGLVVFLLVSLMMLLVLYITSTSTQVSSPIRSA